MLDKITHNQGLKKLPSLSAAQKSKHCLIWQLVNALNTTDLVKAVDVGGDHRVHHLLPPGQPRQDETAVEVHFIVQLDLWVGFLVAGTPRR